MDRKKFERFGKSQKAGTWKLFGNFKPLVKMLLSDEITSYMNAKQQYGSVLRQINPYLGEVLGRIVPQSFAIVAPGFVHAWISSKSFQRVAGSGALATVGAILPRDQGDVGQLAKFGVTRGDNTHRADPLRSLPLSPLLFRKLQHNFR